MGAFPIIVRGSGFEGIGTQPISRMQRQDERDIRELLAKLRAEHRALDEEIAAREVEALPDQLQISRLKKQKLRLKDRITALEDQLLPDIIA